MGMVEFFSKTQQNNNSNLESQQSSVQKSHSSGNKAIDGFCERFYKNVGPDYQNTPFNFIKLAFANIGLVMEMMKSPEIGQIEQLANTAVQKGLISKETLNSFTSAVKFFNKS